MGHRVMTIAPRYDQYKDTWDTNVLVEVYFLIEFFLHISLQLTFTRYWHYSRLTAVLFKVNVGDRTETVRFFHCYKRGVDRVFVDHPMFLEKVTACPFNNLYTYCKLPIFHLNHNM
jgi:granule-bound starch synthase